MTAWPIPHNVRTCTCGGTLWAVMGEPEGWPLLVTLCFRCDVTPAGLTVGPESDSVDRGPGSGSNDSSASAGKAGA